MYENLSSSLNILKYSKRRKQGIVNADSVS